jgi:hypothetical protein
MNKVELSCVANLILARVCLQTTWRQPWFVIISPQFWFATNFFGSPQICPQISLCSPQMSTDNNGLRGQFSREFVCKQPGVSVS